MWRSTFGSVGFCVNAVPGVNSTLMELQAVKGTKDILPDQQFNWERLLLDVGTVFRRAGVGKISIPIFEHSEIFFRSAGESSDLVVQKEMYTFEDRGSRSLTLRPEFTGGVLRAFHEHGMASLPSPVKLWSHGPVFRGEQVQRGRQRQFHQVNYEVLGIEDPLVDAEAISLAYDCLRACGLTGLTVSLGSVGDPEDREKYNAYLRKSLTPFREQLSKASRNRLDLNPLRIWDSKIEEDQQIIKQFEPPLEGLSDKSKRHHLDVTKYLTDWCIPFTIDPTIVRGLDYYRKTAFEIRHHGIGAQNTILGGGRYDGLLANLGGADTAGIGWAFGVERVLDALKGKDSHTPPVEKPDLYLVPLDDLAVSEVANTARSLRESFTVLHAYRVRKPAKGLREASRIHSPLVGLRGEAERGQGTYTVKDLESGEQVNIVESELKEYLISCAAGKNEES